MTARTSVEIGEGLAGRGSRPTPPEQPCDCFAQRPVQPMVQRPVQPMAHPPVQTFSVVGARGGSGTTTIAIVMALVAHALMRTELVTAEPDYLRNLLGLPRFSDQLDLDDGRMAIVAEPTGRAELVVIDEGSMASPSRPAKPPGQRTLGVLRGPCYSALMAMLGECEGIDGLVVVSEPGRALSARDARDVLGIDVVASVPATPKVARAIDAGLLVSRRSHLREFRQLERWLIAQLDPFPARSISAPSTAPNEVLPIGTDMLGAQSAPSTRNAAGC